MSNSFHSDDYFRFRAKIDFQRKISFLLFFVCRDSLGVNNLIFMFVKCTFS